MAKMKNQNNIKEIAFTESQSLRSEAVENANVDFLDKIKAVQYLNEDMVMSIDQIANYYIKISISIKVFSGIFIGIFLCLKIDGVTNRFGEWSLLNHSPILIQRIRKG